MKKLKFVPLQAQLRKLAYDVGRLSALLHEAGENDRESREANNRLIEGLSRVPFSRD